jgi:hypothetical protein
LRCNKLQSITGPPTIYTSEVILAILDENTFL